MFGRRDTTRAGGLLLLLLTGLLLLPGFGYASEVRMIREASGFRPGHSQPPYIELSIRFSPSSPYRTSLQIRSALWAKWLQDLKPAAPAEAAPAYSTIELRVSPTIEGEAQVYRWNKDDHTLSIVSPGNAVTYRLPQEMAEALSNLSQRLSASHYGKLLEWDQASKLMPKGAVFSITDLETGLSFRGQRRAGSSHADVQPLTKEDTAVMKQIYGGEWSWSRRAVLVQSPEGAVAGSMHGMPHGGDGIPDNEFSGHFCIHYKGSVTHGTGHSDPAHQAMIHRAAGLFESYHQTLTPLQTVELFLIAASQKDRSLLQLLNKEESSEKQLLTKEWMDPSIKSVRMIGERDHAEGVRPDASEREASLRTRVVIWRNGARPQAVTMLWKLVRSSDGSPWFIDSITPETVISGQQLNSTK